MSVATSAARRATSSTVSARTGTSGPPIAKPRSAPGAVMFARGGSGPRAAGRLSVVQGQRRATIRSGGPVDRVIHSAGGRAADLRQVGQVDASLGQDALDGGDAQPVQLTVAVHEAAPGGTAP